MLDQRPVAVSHEQFFTTVLAEAGKVKKLSTGKDGACKVFFPNGVRAVLKPKLFSTDTKWGISAASRYLREAAAYQLDRQILKWDVVPPTTLTTWKDVPASIQAWVSGVQASDLAPKLFKRNQGESTGQAVLLAAKVNTVALRKLVLLDLIINNTDRHGRNVVFDTFSNHVWGIDNGCAFGECFTGHYNVFHRLLWPKRLFLTGRERSQLEAISLPQLQKALARYLSLRDITMTFLRIQFVLEQPNLAFGVLSAGGSVIPPFKDWFSERLRAVSPSPVMLAISRMGQTA